MRAAPWLAALAVILVAGLVLWRADEAPFAPHETGSAPAARPQPGERGWSPVWGALEEERVARQRLEEEVASLRLELDVLRSQELAGASSSYEEREREAEAVTRDGAAPLAGTTGAARSMEEPLGAPGRRRFDVSILVEDAGMAPRQAEELRDAFQEIELERLYLRDRARRESWGFRRIRREERLLSTRTAALREEYGDPAYDWYRYASGEPNRVYLEEVLATSPAAESGLAPGDRIVRYDGIPILSGRDLNERISRGEPGEPVVVELDRAGERVRVEIPRGPLGAHLDVRSERPGELP